MNGWDQIIDEILAELKEDENEERIRKEEIIKNGCPHTNKVEKIDTISGKRFLKCDVCGKPFNIKTGRPIK